MKFSWVLLAVFVVLLAIGAYFYFRDDDLERTPIKKPAEVGETTVPGAPADTSKQSFGALCTELQGDMTAIPATLNGTRKVPAHAYGIKSRLDGAENMHPEYGTLVQACDLIIYADQEFSVRQGQVTANRNHTVDSSLQYSKPEDRERANQAANDAVYQQQEALWGEYRKKTDAEVKRLLAMLAGKQL